MGTRFGKYTELIPKGFVEYKQRAMVVRSIDTLIACGVERIIIGTGWKKESYEALAARYNALYGEDGPARLPHPVRLECVYSPRYAETNSMYTLWNCREAIGDDDFLLLESDLVFEPRAIRELMECEFGSAMLITPVTKFQDQYYVQMDARKRLVNCSTDRNAIDPSGELVGIHKLSNAFYQSVVTEYGKVMADQPKLGYEFQLLLTSQKGVEMADAASAASPMPSGRTEPVPGRSADAQANPAPGNYIMNVLRLEGLQWYEIDDQNDLEWAEAHVDID